MRKTCLATLAAVLLTVSAGAQTIKLATLAPPGSPWEQSLRNLAADWARVSDGRVRLRIYAGGIAGDENDMIRKMRIGQLGAAAISGPALSTIRADVLAIQIPRLVENNNELDYLLAEMNPFFVEEFDKLGYKLLLWTKAGWAYIFSRDPVLRPVDLQRQRLWVWKDMADEAKAWSQMGFRPVTHANTDVLVQLQSGGIDAVITSPLIAASNQYFAVIANMTALKWAPLVGAIIVSNRVWDRVPDRYKPELEQAALDLAQDYNSEFVGADQEAIDLMQQYGLTVHEVPQAAQQEWADLVSTGLIEFFGNRFDIAYYRRAQRLLEEYRAENPGS